jgi:hypothetical protein
MFLIHTVDDGRVPALEYRPAASLTPRVGLALRWNDGKLAVNTGANKPVYICMTERSEAVDAGTMLPVIRVAPDIVFESQFIGSSAGVVPGNKLTIASDGLRVTATTANGVAEVVSLDGTAAGDKVRVRFS